MADVILMPRLSDTMTEGVIAAWHKKVGDTVKKGDLLAEVETDKATMELESYKDGVLLHIGTDKGGKLQVNDLLAIIGSAGEDISSLTKTTSAQPAASSQPAAAEKPAATSPQPAPTEKPAAKPAAKAATTTAPAMDISKMDEVVLMPRLSDTMTKGGAAVSAQPTSAEPAASVPETATSQPATSIQQPATSNGRLKASPLAKKLAQEKGIDIKSVHGSGDGGRIVKADVDSYSPQTAAASLQPAPSTAKAVTPVPVFAPVSGEEGFTDIPNSQIRNIIAKRLGESKFSAPHFYLTMEINMDNAMSFRTQLNELSPVKVSFNDMVVKACALALRQHPAVNASWMGDKIRRHHHIHIGIAVAIEDGLIVPVVRFADQKTFPQIAAESKELSGKAKTKKLQPNEFSGNTFTISNLGMMGIEEFTAIINPPDSCIMAVGGIKEIVVRKGEGFGVSNVMKVTLSCDHRSVDGATGAAFLQTVKKYLENPVGMML